MHSFKIRKTLIALVTIVSLSNLTHFPRGQAGTQSNFLTVKEHSQYKTRIDSALQALVNESAKERLNQFWIDDKDSNQNQILGAYWLQGHELILFDPKREGLAPGKLDLSCYRIKLNKDVDPKSFEGPSMSNHMLTYAEAQTILHSCLSGGSFIYFINAKIVYKLVPVMEHPSFKNRVHPALEYFVKKNSKFRINHFYIEKASTDPNVSPMVYWPEGNEFILFEPYREGVPPEELDLSRRRLHLNKDVYPKSYKGNMTSTYMLTFDDMKKIKRSCMSGTAFTIINPKPLH